MTPIPIFPILFTSSLFVILPIHVIVLTSFLSNNRLALCETLSECAVRIYGGGLDLNIAVYYKIITKNVMVS